MRKRKSPEGMNFVPKKENHFKTNPLTGERVLKPEFYLTTLFRDFTNYLSTNVNVEFRGIENLKGINGPIIFFVAPHGSHVDSNFLRRLAGRIDGSIKRYLKIVAAREYWDNPKKKIMQKPFLQVIYQERIVKGKPRRQNFEQMMSDSDMITEYVKSGGNVAYYVEGTRRNEAQTMKDREIKPGAVWTAINARKSNPNIVVVYADGSKQLLVPGSNKVRHRPQKGEPKYNVLFSVSRAFNINDILKPFEKQYGNSFEELTKIEQKNIVNQITALLKEFLINEDKKQNPHLYPEITLDY